MKYQYKVLEKTTITVYFGDIYLWTNTPDTNAPSRTQVAQFGDNFLLNNNPARPFFYRYSYYHIQTDLGISVFIRTWATAGLWTTKAAPIVIGINRIWKRI